MSLLDGVVAAGVQGMTADEPPQGHSEAPEGTMPPDGRQRILGARRVKTAAGGKKGGEKKLVQPNQANERLADDRFKHGFHDPPAQPEDGPAPGRRPGRSSRGCPSLP